MQEVMNVTLPNGTVITNVPADYTQSQVMDLAIQNGLAKAEDFPASKEEGGGVSDWLQSNMDVPMGLTGAMTGARLGAPLGPAGMFVSGTIGGALGTFGGSLLSDELEGEDLDYAKAVEEAAISVGFDLATLGLAKVLKPGWFAAKRALGISPKEAAQEAIKIGTEVGTKESIQATQKILSEQGATLTPYQVGAGGWYTKLKEQLASVGLFSENIMEANTKKVNEIAQKELNEITNSTVLVQAEKGQIASILFDVIQGGKQLLQENYDDAWNGIVKDSSGSLYTTQPLLKAINKFQAERQGKVVNELSDDTIKYIQELRKSWSGASQGGATAYAKFGLEELGVITKKIRSDISGKFGNPNSKDYNAAMDRELSQLSAVLRETTEQMLRKSDPALAARYSAMNTAYSEGMAGLLPEINRNFVAQASKGSFMGLGNLIGKSGNIDQLIAFRKSLNTAFDQAEKAGKSGVAGVVGREEAEALIKRGFLDTKFPDINTGEFDIRTYRDLANRLADKTEARRWRTVLGNDYPRAKQIINLMSEASQNPSSNIGELVLRSKEYQAAPAIVAGTLGGPAFAATVLGLPIFMAKSVTNPKVVNKLLAFDKAKFASEAKRDAAFAVIVSDVLDIMSQEEQAELRNTVRGLGTSQ